MKRKRVTRRHAIAGAVASGIVLGTGRKARAADKVRFLTSWFAEAEHGGFYQAKATGLYQKAGLDVDIKMGGPQVNGLQLLTGGDADVMIGYDIQTLTAVERGFPVTTVGTSFQFDLLGILTHPNINSLADLKGHKILVPASAHTTSWPWLKAKYGVTDDQAAPYTFNMQPFFADPTSTQQAYVTSEPFQCERNHIPYHFFLFAKYGWPPYGSTMVTTQGALSQNRDAIRRFVRASIEGWKSYLQDPTPGNALIKGDNPKMTDDQLAFSVKQLKAVGAVTGGDAAKSGIGTMTDARWLATRDFMVRSNLLRATTDWQSAYTLAYVKDVHVMP